MKSTLKSALNYISILQPLALANGYSLGLTGSCLFHGESDKDIDIIVYPYKTGQEDRAGLDEALIKEGFNKERVCDHSNPRYFDNKHVEEWSHKFQRIDFLFLS